MYRNHFENNNRKKKIKIISIYKKYVFKVQHNDKLKTIKGYKIQVKHEYMCWQILKLFKSLRWLFKEIRKTKKNITN